MSVYEKTNRQIIKCMHRKKKEGLEIKKSGEDVRNVGMEKERKKK